MEAVEEPARGVAQPSESVASEEAGRLRAEGDPGRIGQESLPEVGKGNGETGGEGRAVDPRGTGFRDHRGRGVLDMGRVAQPLDRGPVGAAAPRGKRVEHAGAPDGGRGRIGPQDDPISPPGQRGALEAKLGNRGGSRLDPARAEQAHPAQHLGARQVHAYPGAIEERLPAR